MLRNPPTTPAARRAGGPLAVLRAVAIGALLAALAACGRIGLPFGPGAIDPVTTSAIRPDPAPARPPEPAPTQARVAPSDLEAVRRAAGESLAAAEAGEVLAFANTETGTTGTITPVATTEPPRDEVCRDFTTTLSDYRGVRRYHVEACRRAGGRWELLEVEPDDAELH